MSGFFCVSIGMGEFVNKLLLGVWMRKCWWVLESETTICTSEMWCMLMWVDACKWCVRVCGCWCACVCLWYVRVCVCVLVISVYVCVCLWYLCVCACVYLLLGGCKCACVLQAKSNNSLSKLIASFIDGVTIVREIETSTMSLWEQKQKIDRAKKARKGLSETFSGISKACIDLQKVDQRFKTNDTKNELRAKKKFSWNEKHFGKTGVSSRFVKVARTNKISKFFDRLFNWSMENVIF